VLGTGGTDYQDYELTYIPNAFTLIL